MVKDIKQGMRDVQRDVKKTRMVRSTRTRKQTRWVPRTTTQKAWRTVKKTVIHKKSFPIQQEKKCSCYRQNCGCIGQWNCGCCQPACSCAPIIDSGYRTVEYPVEIAVNEEYDAPVTRHVPEVRDVEFDVMVPEEYVEKESFMEPFEVVGEREVMVAKV